MKKYTIIGGVNGVGKSSLYGALGEESGDFGVVIDVDKITAQLGGDRLKGGYIPEWLLTLKESLEIIIED